MADACPGPISTTNFAIGIVVVVATLWSFLPQIQRMLSNKSSHGVSLVYLLLQCEFGCFAVLHCISAHYRQLFECCTGTTQDCVANTLGFSQFAIICFFSHLLVFLWFVYFEEDHLAGTMTRSGAKIVITGALLTEACAVITMTTLQSLGGSQGQWHGGFGHVCAFLAALFVGVACVPQLYVTCKSKDHTESSLSPWLLVVQGPGYILSAYFQSLFFKVETWVPLAVHGGCTTGLFVLQLYYRYVARIAREQIKLIKPKQQGFFEYGFQADNQSSINGTEDVQRPLGQYGSSSASDDEYLLIASDDDDETNDHMDADFPPESD